MNNDVTGASRPDTLPKRPSNRKPPQVTESSSSLRREVESETRLSGRVRRMPAAQKKSPVSLSVESSPASAWRRRCLVLVGLGAGGAAAIAAAILLRGRSAGGHGEGEDGEEEEQEAFHEKEGRWRESPGQAATWGTLAVRDGSPPLRKARRDARHSRHRREACGWPGKVAGLRPG